MYDLGLRLLELTIQMPMGQMPARKHRLRTRTLGRYIRADLPESVWLAECQDHRQRQRSTKHNGHTPSPRIEIKNPDPTGNRTQTTGWKAGILPTTSQRRTINTVLLNYRVIIIISHVNYMYWFLFKICNICTGNLVSCYTFYSTVCWTNKSTAIKTTRTSNISMKKFRTI